MRNRKVWTGVLIITAGIALAARPTQKNTDTSQMTAEIREALSMPDTGAAGEFGGLPFWQYKGIWCAGLLESESQSAIVVSDASAAKLDDSGVIQLESQDPLILKTSQRWNLSIGEVVTLQNVYGQQQAYEIFGAEKCSQKDWEWISQLDFDWILVSQDSPSWVYMAKAV